MNPVDRIVEWLSPAAGLSRARARAAMEVVRAYEGARVTRRTSGWVSAGSSANAEIGPALATLRNRARDLVRNNPYANHALATLATKSIGTGIMARPDKGAASAWKSFVKTADFEGQLDFYGLQHLIARCAYESGECIVRRIRTRGDNGEVPLKLQVLEGDYIDSTRFGPSSVGGNYIIAGVEIDALGRRVAYWLYDRHPGEVLPMPKNWLSQRVDASEVLHFYEKLRPGQLRGVPRLASAMIKARDLDEYEEAELVRKKIEACFVAFVTGSSAQTLVPATTDAGTQQRVETISPGLIKYLGEESDVKFGSPSASGGYGEYTKT